MTLGVYMCVSVFVNNCVCIHKPYMSRRIDTSTYILVLSTTPKLANIDRIWLHKTASFSLNFWKERVHNMRQDEQVISGLMKRYQNMNHSLLTLDCSAITYMDGKRIAWGAFCLYLSQQHRSFNWRKKSHKVPRPKRKKERKMFMKTKHEWHNIPRFIINVILLKYIGQSTGAVESTDWISAERYAPPPTKEWIWHKSIWWNNLTEWKRMNNVK